MATTANPAPVHALRSNRTAMLVIHGIGEQNPYEALDSFARGVFSYLRDTRHLNVGLCPIENALKDWTQVGMRIDAFPPNVNPPPPCPVKDQEVQPPRPAASGSVDIFEYYWAPETEDKLSWRETVKWLIRTDLTPLRHFANNLQELMNVWRMRLAPALWTSLKLYCREILRVIFVYVPLALGLIWLMTWMSHPRNLGSTLNGILTALRAQLTWPAPLILMFYFLGLLMVWFALQVLKEWLNNPGSGIEHKAETLWLVCDLFLAVFFFAAAGFLEVYFDAEVGLNVLRVLSHHWTPLLAALVVAGVSYALTAYVADVAVYVNTDAKSKNYAARSAILKGSSEALKMILANDQYDWVILAGHSLGSVIAYDTVNELLSQYNAKPGPPSDHPALLLTLPELQKLKGLVTFGCPLDKIYYFFRDYIKRDQAIRAQILSMLHSFRKLPSGRDYGQYEFNYSFRQLDGLVWLNAWAKMDPVSAKLKFYALDELDQRCFPYRVPVLAHLSYWGDANFYSFFGDRLL